VISAGGVDAKAVAERVRAKIASTPLVLADGQPVIITASLGVASTQGSDARTLEALIHTADLALYRAKAHGRNCVRAAHDVMFPSTAPSSIT
jgi:diguanylate cyclase (GGDEF)-like protein